MTVSIPIEKRDKALCLLWDMFNSHKTTIIRVQQLAGLLNHIGHAVVPGHAFNRHFYSKIAGMKKPDHHLSVDKEMKLDCVTWIKFLSDDNALVRPFIDFSSTLVADVINFYSDASKIGVSRYHNSEWYYAL